MGIKFSKISSGLKKAFLIDYFRGNKINRINNEVNNSEIVRPFENKSEMFHPIENKINPGMFHQIENKINPTPLNIVTNFAKNVWVSASTFRDSTFKACGINVNGPILTGTPPIGVPPTIRPPKRPQDEGPQMAFPKRGRNIIENISMVATGGLLLYLAVRIFTLTTVPWISIPIAILLLAAELHSIINGLQYQKDIRNEKRYDKWKIANWPKEEKINKTLSPEGPRTAMQVASAGEEPSTCWPTIYGTVEMEGNKKVIWNTQAGGVWTDMDKPKDDKDDKEYKDILRTFYSKLEILEKKYTHPEYQNTLGEVRKLLTESHYDSKGLDDLKKLHKKINGELGIIPYSEKLRLVKSVNEEYGAVWDWIKEQTGTASTGKSPETSKWIVPDEAEMNDRASSLTKWNALSREEKTESLAKIYSMLGRRHITRGGLWAWWGSEKAKIENSADLEIELKKVFFGVLRTSGEVEEVGLGDEVDIKNYGYTDAGTYHSFDEKGKCPKLAEKVLAYMQADLNGSTDAEKKIYGFDYMRDLIGMDKREQAASNKDEKLDYFPRNIRSGGEDIKAGLEYETLAEECKSWSADDLDAQFNRIINTYVNHKVTWWDRDRFADMDHGGRKSNSINSFVHHLDGKWHKVIKDGTAPSAKDNLGAIIAADNYSALMRVFLEKLENGQYVWDSLKKLPNFKSGLNNIKNPAEMKEYIVNALDAIEVKAKRWITINSFLTDMVTTVFPDPINAESLENNLHNERMLPKDISSKLEKEIKRASAWLIRAGDIEAQRRVLHYFFDKAGHELRLDPHGESLKKIIDLSIMDQKLPDGYVKSELYNFEDIEYFTNIDAEVRPRSDFMARTIPLLDKLIKDGEIPPEPTTTEKILSFGRPRKMIKAGFLQCPQFYTIDPKGGETIHLVAHTDQRLFYQTIQPSKSLNDGAFSCGSNVVYHVSSKRETSERLFMEPESVTKKDLKNTQPFGSGGKVAPGGWSSKYAASEIYVTDINGNRRLMVAYQTAESPTEDHASTIHFLDHEEGKKAESRKGVFLNDVIGKGEAPKNLNNLLGKQHPKWAGGTIGDFFYIIMPRYMRSIPGASYVAQQTLNLINWLTPGKNVRKIIGPAGRLTDKILSNIPLVKHLWYLSKISAKYLNHLTWETAMSHKPKMNPFSKVGQEFFRSGTWYFRGLRDIILISAPVMLTTSILGSALLGQIFTGLFTPMIISPWLLIPVMVAYLAITLTSYLYSTKRLGQKVGDVMGKKEAVLYGQGWPGYLQADFWGLRGPSGRLGATTTKGVGGKEAFDFKYAFPSFVAGTASLAGAGVGTWLLANSCYYLGAATAFGGPGLGIAICTFWALYNGFMIFRGFHVSQGLGTITKDIAKGIKKYFSELGPVKYVSQHPWAKRIALTASILAALGGGGGIVKHYIDLSTHKEITDEETSLKNDINDLKKSLTSREFTRASKLVEEINLLRDAYAVKGKVPLEYLSKQRLALAHDYKELYLITQKQEYLNKAIETLEDQISRPVYNISYGTDKYPFVNNYFDLRLELAEAYRLSKAPKRIFEVNEILAALDNSALKDAQKIPETSVGGYSSRAKLILGQIYYDQGDASKAKDLLGQVVKWSSNEATRNNFDLVLEGKSPKDILEGKITKDVHFLEAKARITLAQIAISEQDYKTAFTHLWRIFSFEESGSKDGFMDLGIESLVLAMQACLEQSPNDLAGAKVKFGKSLPWLWINQYPDLRQALLIGDSSQIAPDKLWDKILTGLTKTDVISKDSSLKTFGNKQGSIWNALVLKGYIDENGKVQPKFDGDKSTFDLGISLSSKELNELFYILTPGPDLDPELKSLILQIKYNSPFPLYLK